VTQEEAQKYAEEEGLMWMEASAKTGEGVQDIFMTIGTYAPWISRAANARTGVYNSDGPCLLTLFSSL
jgi:Ras-related protein Rab-5C